jgi:hypothetical protein
VDELVVVVTTTTAAVVAHIHDMDFTHNLVLNEEVLKSLSDQKKPIFIFEWLRFVEQSLLGAQKVIMGSSVVRVVTSHERRIHSCVCFSCLQTDIKECQKKLMDQLIAQINEPSGPPTRRLIARCLSTLFTVGDTFLLFEAINKCNDILKNKDDSPSFRPIKL